MDNRCSGTIVLPSKTLKAIRQHRNNTILGLKRANVLVFGVKFNGQKKGQKEDLTELEFEMLFNGDFFRMFLSKETENNSLHEFIYKLDIKRLELSHEIGDGEECTIEYIDGEEYPDHESYDQLVAYSKNRPMYKNGITNYISYDDYKACRHLFLPYFNLELVPTVTKERDEKIEEVYKEKNIKKSVAERWYI